MQAGGRWQEEMGSKEGQVGTLGLVRAVSESPRYGKVVTWDGCGLLWGDDERHVGWATSMLAGIRRRWAWLRSDG